MMRVQQEAPPSKHVVLDHLVATVGLNEVFVQLGATITHPRAISNLVDGDQIGLLHLGPGRHANFEMFLPCLAPGAIVLFENCFQDSPAKEYAAGYAALDYLSSPTEARHWPGLAVCTYKGKAR